jgi:GNAT superfamily N-acetyltransferase
MIPDRHRFALSPLEEERFGVRTMRVNAFELGLLPPLLAFCRANAVRMVIARCPSEDVASAQALEDAGGRLMDTLLYYNLELARKPQAEPPARVRLARPQEVETLVAIADESFRDYRGHYHADPRLDRSACDATYTDWVRRSLLDRKVADAVYACEIDGKLAAFATMRANSPEEGEGVLFGVAPWAKGRGIYADLIRAGIEWCRARGHARMIVSTQITNLAVQKVWVRQGFEPSASYFTFHLWLP